MVDELSEGWRLPSILQASSQVAQIGPFIYMVIKILYPNRFKLSSVIYFILTLGNIIFDFSKSIKTISIILVVILKELYLVFY